MKVAILKPKKRGKKLVFDIEGKIEEKSIEQFEDIANDVINFKFQQYIINNSRTSNSNGLSKRFK